ncbi:hypothetical protein BN000_02185 [Mycobacterium europaeum]|uniref:Uncharacterized protein n=1 Tax=Mycobacterium europaeum TaxID=761804 RepID=A0A0U1D922_9MYCO|nr:hypothetical protein [Mycobacterium europaeum]CQD10586.1 hypothetical protein BN000_02185 [Mycobacterium europaeum]
MTLLQTSVYPGGVLQVSDRRLTNSKTKSVITDSQNKAVSWCARRSVCFNGIARIDKAQKKPVSHWIAETLADHMTLDDGVEALRVGATKQIKKLPSTWDTRLSIIVAGIHDLAIMDNNQHITPIAAVRRISNYENPEAGPRFDEFVVHKVDMPFGQGRYLYGHNGWLSRDENKAMTKGLARMYGRPGGVKHAARLMIQMQRRIADRPKSSVGHDAMVVWIPAVLPNPNQATILTHPDEVDFTGQIPRFYFVRAGGVTTETFGPDWACGGWAHTNARATTTGNNQTISIKLLKVPKPPL